MGKRIETLFLAGTITSLPFPYLPLFSIAGISVKPVHICIIFLSLFTLVRVRARLRPITGLQALVLLTFSVRLCVYLLSLFWAPDPSVGFFEMLRELTNFTLFILFFVSLKEMSGHQVFQGLILGVALQVLVISGIFLVANTLSGVDSLSIIIDGFVSGDLQRIKAGVYLGGLKVLGLAGTEINAREISVNSTNAMGSAILMAIFFAINTIRFAGSPPDREELKPRRKRIQLTRLVLVIGSIHGFFYIVWGLSDRVYAFILFLALLYGAVLALDALRMKATGRKAFAVVACAGLILLLIVVIAANYTYTFQAVSNFLQNPRFDDLTVIAHHINDAGLFGHGFGTPIEGTGTLLELGYRYPHNLWLSDLASFGVIGIITSGLWSGVLLIVLLISARRIFESPINSSARSHSMLTVIGVGYAIMTTQIAAMGQLYLIGWCALAFGLAFLDSGTQKRIS